MAESRYDILELSETRGMVIDEQDERARRRRGDGSSSGSMSTWGHSLGTTNVEGPSKPQVKTILDVEVQGPRVRITTRARSGKARRSGRSGAGPRVSAFGT